MIYSLNTKIQTLNDDFNINFFQNIHIINNIYINQTL